MFLAIFLIDSLALNVVIHRFVVCVVSYLWRAQLIHDVKEALNGKRKRQEA